MGLSKIEKPKIVAGSIAVYEGIFEDHKETIDSLISISLDSSLDIQFTPSKTFHDIENEFSDKESVRTSFSLSIGNAAKVNKTAKDIYDKCNNLLGLAVKEYRNIFKIQEEIKEAESYSLLRYTTGQHYKQHYDGNIESGRVISVLIYLNDDYDGGEIEFPNFNLKIKPKSGTLILFPSNYAYSHIAHDVISGTKYVIVTWLKDK
jgi:Rps23 Pro-64 3,4-dihydroxylase Tpa1-like proline 4-hydroxylase